MEENLTPEEKIEQYQNDYYKYGEPEIQKHKRIGFDQNWEMILLDDIQNDLINEKDIIF